MKDILPTRTNRQATTPRFQPINEEPSSPWVLFAYLAISMCYFSLVLLRDPSQGYLGYPSDPALFTWALAWWPYAIAHGLNPFLTRMLWAPVGYNLTWTTSVPALSLLISPITYLLGPLVSFNLLSLIAPALDAWAAFLLCRLIGAGCSSAFVGGYIFGFSPYVIGQVLGGHLHLTFMMWIPLAVYLCIKKSRGEMAAARFAVFFALVAVAEFLTSTEVFATMTMMGTIAFLIIFAVGDGELRHRLIGLFEALCVAYLIAGAVLSPFLYYVFAFPQKPIAAGFFYNAGFARLVAPTADLLLSPYQLTALAHHHFASLDRGDLVETGLYLGPAALVLVFRFASRQWHSWHCRALLITLGLAWILALGAYRSVHGLQLPLPWSVFRRLPLIGDALPVRLSLYGYLSLAIVVALAIDDLQTLTSRTCAAILTIAFFIPAMWFTNRVVTQIDMPGFFASDLYKSQLHKGAVVLGVPIDQSMIWQARTGMYFRLAEAWTGGIPREVGRDNFIPPFPTDGSAPQPELLRSFIARTDATAVIVDSKSSAAAFDLQPILCVPKLEIGGVVLYRLPAPNLEKCLACTITNPTAQTKYQ